MSFKLYFENLFRGLLLLNSLNDYGCKGAETIRENRIPIGMSFKKFKRDEKMNRGSYSIQTSKDEKISITRTLNNSVAIFTSITLLP